MDRRISAFALIFALCCTLGAPALADPQPEDAKDYRQTVMTALGGHIGAISMHMRGLVEDHGFLARHAEALAITVLELRHLFPEGSGVGDSEALPAVWGQPEEFAEAITRTEQAAATFSAAAASGDEAATAAAFRDVASACRGCHDRFREKHEH